MILYKLCENDILISDYELYTLDIIFVSPEEKLANILNFLQNYAFSTLSKRVRVYGPDYLLLYDSDIIENYDEMREELYRYLDMDIWEARITKDLFKIILAEEEELR